MVRFEKPIFDSILLLVFVLENKDLLDAIENLVFMLMKKQFHNHVGSSTFFAVFLCNFFVGAKKLKIRLSSFTPISSYFQFSGFFFACLDF